MAKNYVHKGNVLPLTAPYARAAGEGALIGTLFAVALDAVANAAVGQFSTMGVWDLAKVSAQAWTEGAAIYWDNAAKLCTTVSAGNTLIGVATAVAVNPTAVGRVRLNK